MNILLLLLLSVSVSFSGCAANTAVNQPVRTVFVANFPTPSKSAKNQIISGFTVTNPTNCPVTIKEFELVIWDVEYLAKLSLARNDNPLGISSTRFECQQISLDRGEANLRCQTDIHVQAGNTLAIWLYGDALNYPETKLVYLKIKDAVAVDQNGNRLPFIGTNGTNIAMR